MMTFAVATFDDAQEILKVIQESVIVLKDMGVDQWDEIYPTIEDVKKDITEQSLQVGRINGEIAVTFTINSEYDEEYASGEWTEQSGYFQVIHRFAVHSKYQNRGIARKTLTYIHQEQKKRGVKSIRLDAFTQNPYSVRLYQNMGYQIVGQVTFRKGQFHLMEKVL